MKPITIRRLRKRLGWSQQRLAKALGVDHNTVSRWELGRRAIPEPTARLLRALGKTANE